MIKKKKTTKKTKKKTAKIKRVQPVFDESIDITPPFPEHQGENTTLPYIIRDTREKHGWQFNGNEYWAGTIDNGIRTGDYTIQGYEDILCIERKGGILEIANNINEERFERQLERMRDFKYARIVCEFNMNDVLNFPHSAPLPPYQKSKIRIGGDFILRRLMEVEFEYPNIHIIFAGKFGQRVTESIFKRVLERG